LLSYSLLQLGYFIEDMVMHTFVRERTSDFWEMHLHHFLTITLIGGMIMQNFIRAGTIISWLHCLSDVWTASSRVLSQTVFKKATITSFILCTFFWFIFRNICIPLACWDLWLYLKYPEELNAY
jgi:hypothetical protein